MKVDYISPHSFHTGTISSYTRMIQTEGSNYCGRFFSNFLLSTNTVCYILNKQLSRILFRSHGYNHFFPLHEDTPSTSIIIVIMSKSPMVF